MDKETSEMHSLNEYQKLALRTAMPVKVEGDFVYPLLGLSGEVGELVNKIKKIFRDDAGKITPERKQDVLLELGDVLWYLTQIATEFDLTLEEVAQTNIDKLASRQARGKIVGSGDIR